LRSIGLALRGLALRGAPLQHRVNRAIRLQQREEFPFYTVGLVSGGARNEKMVWRPISIYRRINFGTEYECDIVRYYPRSHRRAHSECTGHRAKYTDGSGPDQRYKRSWSVCVSERAAGDLPSHGRIVWIPE